MIYAASSDALAPGNEPLHVGATKVEKAVYQDDGRPPLSADSDIKARSWRSHGDLTHSASFDSDDNDAPSKPGGAALDLFKADQKIAHVTFPESGVASIGADTGEGRFEVGMVGSEGLVGVRS